MVDSMKSQYQHLTTFLVTGEYAVKATAPVGSNWHLLLVSRVDKNLSESCDLLGQPIHGDTKGDTQLVVHFEGKMVNHSTSLQLASRSSVVFRLSNRKSVLQLVFGSNSDENMVTEPADPVSMFETKFSSVFFRKVKEIKVNSNTALCQLCNLLSANCKAVLFRNPRPVVDEKVDDRVATFLKSIRDCLLSQVFQLFREFDRRLSQGGKLKHSDVYVLLKILTMFPELSEYVTAFCLHAANQIPFLAILTEFPGCDQGLFNRQLAVREYEEEGAIWTILCYVVGHRSVIASNMLELFARIIPMRRLQKLLQCNQIRSESQSLARELSFMSDDSLNEHLQKNVEIDGDSLVAHDWTLPEEEIEQSTPRKLWNPFAHISVGVEIFVIGVIAIVVCLLMLNRI